MEFAKPRATSRQAGPAGQQGPPHPRLSDSLSGRRYRKVVSNVCEGGVDPQQSPAQLQCPLLPPRGLQVSILGEAVAVRPGEDVLFVVRQEQVRRLFNRAHGAPGGALSASTSVRAASLDQRFPNCGRGEWAGGPVPGAPSQVQTSTETMKRKSQKRGQRQGGNGAACSEHRPRGAWLQTSLCLCVHRAVTSDFCLPVGAVKLFETLIILS